MQPRNRVQTIKKKQKNLETLREQILGNTHTLGTSTTSFTTGLMGLLFDKRSPKPETLHPKPSTLNPQPSTLTNP